MCYVFFFNKILQKTDIGKFENFFFYIFFFLSQILQIVNFNNCLPKILEIASFHVVLYFFFLLIVAFCALFNGSFRRCEVEFRWKVDTWIEICNPFRSSMGQPTTRCSNYSYVSIVHQQSVNSKKIKQFIIQILAPTIYQPVKATMAVDQNGN